ncbi:Adenylate cyclase 2 [Diplonema papillatum]|nr:Adenylate cyclase 2 [Diplonema papillatum]
MGCGASTDQPKKDGKREKDVAASSPLQQLEDRKREKKDKKEREKDKDKKDKKVKKKDSKDKYETRSKDEGRFKGGFSGKSDTSISRKRERNNAKRQDALKKLQQASEYAEVLSPYLPWPVLKQFQKDTSQVTSPELSSFQGVIMMVDISGFTALGESLAKLPNMLGVELLASYINGYFSQLIDCVTDYGGAVEKFAGDALIVLFGNQYSTAPLSSLALAAVNCALAIQHRYPSYVARISKDAPGERDREMGVHIGIGASLVKTMTTGGLGDSWRRLVFGEVFEQLAVAMPLSKVGQVVISNECWTSVQSEKGASLFTGTPVEYEGKEAMLVDCAQGQTIPAGTPVQEIVLTKAMERAARGFVDLFVQSRLDEGQTSISEARSLSMLFMGVNNWDVLSKRLDSTTSPAFSSLNHMVRGIQNIVYGYEGCIANCLVDEKGFSLLITYGMPQHSDDPMRAIKSALEIRDRCEQHGIGLSIGVTSGETFVGSIGSVKRRDYTIMGSSVNLGARLMSMCEAMHRRLQAPPGSNDAAHDHQADPLCPHNVTSTHPTPRSGATDHDTHHSAIQQAPSGSLTGGTPRGEPLNKPHAHGYAPEEEGGATDEKNSVVSSSVNSQNLRQVHASEVALGPLGSNNGGSATQLLQQKSSQEDQTSNSARGHEARPLPNSARGPAFSPVHASKPPEVAKPQEDEVWSQILVDITTFRLTKKLALYDTSIPPQSVRGHSDPIQLFVPIKLFKGRRDFAAHQQAQGEGEIDSEDDDEERQLVTIGRANELRLLEQIRDEVVGCSKDAECSPAMPALGKSQSPIRTRIVIVYGEGGMGKSKLIRHCAMPIEKGTIPGIVVETSAEATKKDTSYAIWEPVFGHILLGNLAPHESKQKRLNQTLLTLSKTDDWMEFGYLNLELDCYLALLNPVLKTAFREPSQLSDIGPALRAKTTVSLLHIILKHISRETPLLLLFDSMHNCHDVQSLELILQLAESKDRTSRIMIVCSQRPPDTDNAAAVTEIRQGGMLWMRIREFTQSTTIITLKALTEEQSTELLIHLLNTQLQACPDIPEIKDTDKPLANFVYKNSRNGKIFLLVAIANAFRDELIKADRTKSPLGLTGNRLHFIGSEDASFNLHLPKSVTHFARSTIDRLQATLQLTVKCAAVVGKRFTLESLQEIFPISKSKNAILSAVLKLIEQRIFHELADKGKQQSTYRFVDVVVQEEAYSMVLHEQKMQMHKQLADWMERKLLEEEDEGESDEADDTHPDTVSQLARHWSAYVRYADEKASLEDIEKATNRLRGHAKWQLQCGDYAAAFDLLDSAYDIVSLRRKKDDSDETNESELRILADMVLPVHRARQRFTSEYVLKLHQKTLAVPVTTMSDEAWEAKYSATCGLASELARMERIPEALQALEDAEAMTQEAGGPVESVLGAVTSVTVHSHCGDHNDDIIELVKELLGDSSWEAGMFAQVKLSTWFSGFSSGMPMPDLHIELKMAYIMLGNYSQAETVEDVTKTFTKKGKGVNQARLYCLACKPAAVLRNHGLVTKHADNALEIASKVGDALSVSLATFFLSISRRPVQADEVLDSFRALSKAFGPLSLYKCLMLDAIFESDSFDAKQFVEYLAPPVSELQCAPDLLRLQAMLLLKLYKSDPDVAAEHVEAGPEVLEARVFNVCEAKFVAAYQMARARNSKHFQLKVLGSFYQFWIQTGVLAVTSSAGFVLLEICRLLEKSGDIGKRMVPAETLQESEQVRQRVAGTRGSKTRMDIEKRTAETWGALIQDPANNDESE